MSSLWSWIETVVGLVGSHPNWAMAAAFFFAIIEAVAVFGTFFPGTYVFMAVTGAAAAAGQPMLPYLLLAILGATIGDYVSFWFGSRFAPTLRSMWPFSRKPELLTKADWFFDKYGTASVALCRFVPVLRSTVPLVAGMAGMERRRFLIANVSSACVWAPAHVYPAQFAGMTLQALKDGDWLTSAFWASMLAICFASVWVLHRVVGRIR